MLPSCLTWRMVAPPYGEVSVFDVILHRSSLAATHDHHWIGWTDVMILEYRIILPSTISGVLV